MGKSGDDGGFDEISYNSRVCQIQATRKSTLSSKLRVTAQSGDFWYPRQVLLQEKVQLVASISRSLCQAQYYGGSYGHLILSNSYRLEQGRGPLGFKKLQGCACAETRL